ncbi:helix-turn-helix domain-containing protein [Flavihumibacter petaseus]|uniref:Putative AraC family transcriptional regulator n=1 Tax=Flavihumibacter petaseus NBRC 106054 TaxID=1220578 RepID=A0A0E9N4E1_9BACT|nr:helix-turn-helix domain-containing protein [Flavihumibacter petaseus]GAO44694.1 putative AraC family transcriptional regulator [Flavihumibacter petaseus NBRC 106054]
MLPTLSAPEHIGISALRVIREDIASRYEIIWLSQGAGHLTVNRNRNVLGNGLVYVVSPGQLRMIDLYAGSTGYHLSVSPQLFHAADSKLVFVSMLEQCSRLGNAMTMQAGADNDKEIEELLLKIEQETKTVHHLQLEMLQAFFRTLVLYLSRLTVVGRDWHNTTNDQRIVRSFIQLVNNHYIRKKMVAEYAQELCVTRSYLNKIVKKVSGSTASEIIQQRIIQEAKKEAIRSGSSLKQIAYSLGFDDCAHFSKFFKSNCGMSFTDYKKELEVFR